MRTRNGYSGDEVLISRVGIGVRGAVHFYDEGNNQMGSPPAGSSTSSFLEATERGCASFSFQVHSQIPRPREHALGAH